MIQNGLRIEYESEDFPANSLNGVKDLRVTWDDIAWASITVGRPDLYYVFNHAESSFYEALFRLSLVKLAVEQHGAHGSRLWRTSAFKAMDPSEKGAVNYFLGLIFCKLFASRVLGAPWLLHLDVFRDQLAAQALGRSRPDLVGQNSITGEWLAFECKGRSTKPNDAAKTKAKAQAQRLVSVDGQDCSLHVGAITFFANDTLKFYWRDPVPESRAKLITVAEVGREWEHYYRAAYELVGRSDIDPMSPITRLPQADVTIGIHPAVLEHLNRGEWDLARKRALDLRAELIEGGYQPDGIIVETGRSWRERLKDWE